VENFPQVLNLPEIDLATIPYVNNPEVGIHRDFAQEPHGLVGIREPQLLGNLRPIERAERSKLAELFAVVSLPGGQSVLPYRR
jgi:hypothetical protein